MLGLSPKKDSYSNHKTTDRGWATLKIQRNGGKIHRVAILNPSVYVCLCIMCIYIYWFRVMYWGRLRCLLVEAREVYSKYQFGELFVQIVRRGKLSDWPCVELESIVRGSIFGTM